MPLAPNPLFVGRGDELLVVARALRGAETTVALGQVVASTGLGGLGKTQMAVEFVHRYGQFFAGGVYWLSFASADEIPLQVAACAEPGLESRPLEERVRWVQDTWQSAVPRLLVFDNCEEEALLAAWRPPSGGCRVLVTARRSTWDPVLGVGILSLGPLRRADSIDLLRRFRPDLSSDDARLDGIARELGDLPLALHLAGRFLDRYRHEVVTDDYLADLGGAGLLGHPSLALGQGLDPSEPSRPLWGVAQSFALSYQRLNPAVEVDRTAVALLARAARLAPGAAFGRQLLLRTLGETPCDDHGRQLADSLERLESLGLLERSDATYRLHRLLARFIVDLNPDASAQQAVEDVMIDCGRLAQEQLLTGPSLLGVLPHLTHAANEAKRAGNDLRTAALANATGQALHGAGAYASARQYLEQAVRIREQVLGLDRPETASSLDGLAVVLFDSGDLTAARPLFERAIDIKERTLGPDHADTAASLQHLGRLLLAQGEIATARALFDRGLAITVRAVGAEHPWTAVALDDLAIALRDQGNMTGALPLLERALAIRERRLGTEHPDTAGSLNDLALLIGDLGDLAAARELHERAVVIRERILGPTHSRTAQSLNHIARVLRDQGEPAAAKPMFERALRIWETAHGPDHLLAAHALNGLGRTLHQLGDLTAARAAHERALTIRERSLGPANPRTAQSLINLAAVLRDQRDLGPARAMLERALAINERILGHDHARTAHASDSLGHLLLQMGDRAAPRPLFERALAVRERVLGPDHPDTVATRRALAELAAEGAGPAAGG